MSSESVRGEGGIRGCLGTTWVHEDRATGWEMCSHPVTHLVTHIVLLGLLGPFTLGKPEVIPSDRKSVV